MFLCEENVDSVPMGPFASITITLSFRHRPNLKAALGHGSAFTTQLLLLSSQVREVCTEHALAMDKT